MLNFRYARFHPKRPTLPNVSIRKRRSFAFTQSSWNPTKTLTNSLVHAPVLFF